MSELEIITNNNWRPFLYRNEVPDEILKNEFDYLSNDDINGYIKYRNNWRELIETRLKD